MNIFKYDDDKGEIVIDEFEILLVKEFAALYDKERNKCKEDKTGKDRLLAIKEFTYMWLAIDWKSFYSEYSEAEKHEEALKDSGLTEVEYNDPLFKAGCRKYQELQNSSRALKMLNGAYKTVDSIIFYLETIDVSERDVVTGKPIFKTKDIIAEIKNCRDLLDGLKELENAVKKEQKVDTKLRGGAEQFLFDK